MQDERDAVDKVLKALGGVETPEGLEARVLAGVERRVLASRESEFRWRDVVRGSAVAGAWWRGAASGAAVAMLVVGIGAGYAVRAASSARGQVMTMDTAARVRLQAYEAQARGEMRPVVERQGACAGEGFHLVPVHGVAATGMPVAQGERVAGGRFERVPFERARFQQSGAIVDGPLTAQERDLVRVARDVGFRQLASLNPEIRERLAAEDAAQFQHFFAQAKTVSVDASAATDAAIAQPAGEPVQTQAPAMEPQPENETGEKR